MGMYDDLYVDYPLPDDPPMSGFQTKSLACELRHFSIGSDGTLRRYGELVPYSGSCHFYAWGDDGVYYSYDAVFVNGRIQTVERAGRFWDRY